MENSETQPGAARTGTGVLTGPASAAGKLAILRQILAEACRELEQALSPAGEPKLELRLGAVDLGKAGDVLAAHSESIATAALRAAQWDSSLLAGLDRDFLYSLVDVIFGGVGAETPFRPERNLTRIETEVVKVVFGQMTRTLERSFGQTGAVSFSVERTDVPPAYDVIGRPSSVIAVVTVELACAAGGGRMFIAVPQSAFVFLRPPQARKQAAAALALDPQWRSLLGNRLYGADVTMTAVLGSKQMTLGEIADLRLGQIIEIDSVTGHRVSLDCNGQKLYWCKLAQANGAYSLNVEDAINHEQEFMDDILSH
ncbi:MAG: FliM/FliN family flagellar motor switch protein [Pseudomonadota bacterium]